MTSDKTHNGWTNYQTWNVKLWIDNNEGLYNMVLEAARDVEAPELSEQLQEMIEEMNPIVDKADMFTDILNHALSAVNWYEIAKSFKDDISEGY